MKFAQSRKYSVDIWYTSQGYHHTVKRLRDLTNEVVKCERRGIGNFFMFSNITYNPDFFDQKLIFNIELEKKFILRRKIINNWRAHFVFKAYDTFFKVDSSALTDIDKHKILDEND